MNEDTTNADYELKLRDMAEKVALLEHELQTAKHNELMLWRMIGPQLLRQEQGD